jgi:hypothetical protein
VDILYPLPWPARNQEAVISHRLDYLSAAGFRIELTSDDQPPKRLDPKSSLVLKTKGSWTAVRQKTGAFLLSYKVLTMQNRGLPRWLFDPIIRSNMVHSMSALRELAQSDIN